MYEHQPSADRPYGAVSGASRLVHGTAIKGLQFRIGTPAAPPIWCVWLQLCSLNVMKIAQNWLRNLRNLFTLVDSERTRELGPEGPKLAGASSYSNACGQWLAK